MTDFPSAAYDSWKQDAPDIDLDEEAAELESYEPDHDAESDDDWLRDRGYDV